MIGLTEQMLYKSLVNAHLIISELEGIALDIEININNRPLMYVDNDLELPILTPSSLIYGHSIRVQENGFDDDDNNFLKRESFT